MMNTACDVSINIGRFRLPARDSPVGITGFGFAATRTAGSDTDNVWQRVGSTTHLLFSMNNHQISTIMTADNQVHTKTKKLQQKQPKPPETDMFTRLCRSDLKIEVVKEFQFHPTRKWRFDYAIPAHRIAIEVEGGVFTRGRRRATGIIRQS